METHTFDCGCSWPVMGRRQDGSPILDIDLEIAPFCQKVADIYATGKTKGIFQLEKPLGKTWSKKMKPEIDEHITALVALLRPGCLKAKDADGVSMTEHYVRRRHNTEIPPVFHPAVDSVIDDTYRVITYQEQSIELSKQVAGFTAIEADLLRRGIGKKDSAKLAECRRLFIQKATAANIISEEQAIELFNTIEYSNRYSFNRCVSGDTRISRMENQYALPVAEMYKIRNNIEYAKETERIALRKKWAKNYGYGLSLCSDGRIRHNIVTDIQPAGRRAVFTLRTKFGDVKLTDNHRVPTNYGELLVSEIANLLKSNHEVHVYQRGSYEPTDKRKYNFSELPQHRQGFVNKAFGENNSGYTNGQYTAFKQTAQLLPKQCNHCGKSTGRLEVDHIDRNRQNNVLSNLQRLCPSCHKKKEYKSGRIKRGQKGYPHILTKVLEIAYHGVEDTYDVTMTAPNHNFVVNDGLVVCNSHAYSYALRSIKTAYLKSHFPVEFFHNWLKLAHLDGDPDEIPQLVEDARGFGVSVVSPDLISKSKRMSIIDGDIEFGLGDIKGVGNSQTTKLLDIIRDCEAENGPITGWTWEYLLVKVLVNINTNTAEAIIGSGALSYWKKSRRRMLFELSTCNQLTELELKWLSSRVNDGLSIVEYLTMLAKPKKEGGGVANVKRGALITELVGVLNKPLSTDQDTPDFLVDVERKYLGVELTCTKLDGRNTQAATYKCCELATGIKDRVKVAAEIRDARVITTKKGDSMAFLTIGDDTGTLSDIIVFPDKWQEFAPILRKRNTVMIEGEPDRRSGGFVVQGVWELQSRSSNGE